MNTGCTQKNAGQSSSFDPRKPLASGSTPHPNLLKKNFRKQRYYAQSAPARQDVSESWDSIFSRCGLPEPKRGRARCPFHDGDSPTSLAVNGEKGVFYCHVCHASGDKIAFIRKLHGCSFAQALAFFGLAFGGKWPQSDPETIRANQVLKGLDLWVRQERKRTGKLIYELGKTIDMAKIRLSADPNDRRAWIALEIAHKAHSRLEYKHDCLMSRDIADRVDIFLAGGEHER